MRIIVGVLVVLSITSTVAAQGDIQWAEPLSSTLYIGGTINVGDYTVKVSQFHKPVLGIRDIDGNVIPRDDFQPTVVMDLYRNGSFVDSFPLTQFHNTFVSEDEEVKVTLEEIAPRTSRVWVYEYYGPWVMIGVRLRGVPDLEISVNTDKNTYTSNRDGTIILNVTLRNNGETDIKNVTLSVFFDNLSLQYGKKQDLNPRFSTIRIDEEQKIEMNLIVPTTILETQKYILSAASRGYDSKDQLYEDFDFKVIAIVPPDDVILSKYVKKSIYLSETATVYLKLTNAGVFKISNIRVQDSISDHFTLVSDSILEWEIPQLSPGEEKVIGSYELRPLETSQTAFQLPRSVAYYSVKDMMFMIESEPPLILVNGPKIVIEKSARMDAGSDIEITIIVRNEGNAPTKVSVHDELPPEAMLIQGNNSLSQSFLDSYSLLTMTYTMRVPAEGNITLPAATAEFYDISSIRDNIRRTVYSDTVNIMMGQTLVGPTGTIFPARTPRTPVGTISHDGDKFIPGFSGWLLFLLIIGIYFILRE